MADQKKEVVTALSSVVNQLSTHIERLLVSNGVKMDGYAKQCVINSISAIHSVLDAKNIKWNDAQFDRSTVDQALQFVACMKLNASASPREIYYQIRNVAIKDGKGNTIGWKKQLELGIEGDGNDSILARFGRDVKKVAQFWMVREHDQFEYPKYNGLDMEPPKWTPSGKGDVVRVVYPVLKTDHSVEFYIAEREDVTRNLIAHISNNMMNATFGICADRYKATDAQKKQIAAKKAEILKKAKELGLDATDDPELQEYISPAWKEYQSREQMIIRKMRNNIVKKIPKDFGSAFIEMTYAESSDETLAQANREITEYANGEVIDIELEDVESGNDHETEQTNPAKEDKFTEVGLPDPSTTEGQPAEVLFDEPPKKTNKPRRGPSWG